MTTHNAIEACTERAPAAEPECTRREMFGQATALLFAAASLPVLSSCGERSRNGASPQNSDDISHAILMYMAQPFFSGEHMERQLTGVDVKLQQLDLRTTPPMVYWTSPYIEGEPATAAAAAHARLTHRPENIEYADSVAGRLRFPDGTSIRHSREHGYLFRFPASDFRVEPSAKVSREFRDGVTYDITAAELVQYLRNESVRGGTLRIDLGRLTRGRPEQMYNHDAFVAKAGEPSLKRLVHSLTKDADNREASIQCLCDFVTREIKYSQTEATFDVEVLKRPNETLLSGESDCSGKTILLASLLEQIGERYVYLIWNDPTNERANHIALAVAQGEFPTRNNVSTVALRGDAVPYILIEATADSFQIGISRLTAGDTMRSLSHIQRPGSAQLEREFKLIASR